MAANPKKPARVRYGAGGPVMAAPSPTQEVSLTSEAAKLEDAWGLAQQSWYLNNAMLRNDYRTEMAQTQKEKIANLAATENNALGRGVFSGSADVSGRIGVEADAVYQQNVARNTLLKGMIQNDLDLQEAALQYGYGSDLVSLSRFAYGAEATVDAYLMGVFDSPKGWRYVPGKGGTRGYWFRKPGYYTPQEEGVTPLASSL